MYRFQTPVKAGETKTYTVKEEKDISASIQLTNNADDTIRHFINLAEASPALKQKLQDALKVKEIVGRGSSRTGASGRGPPAAEPGPGSDPEESA